MEKKLLFTFLFFTLSLVHSQIKYEPGYIITHNGEKTQVLIQNVDWKANPSSINYKINKTAEVKKATTHEIKEFEVGNYHYVTVTVDVDQSSHITSKLSTNRNPEFKAETLFLRYLVNGPANLYALEGNDIKYFYNTSGKPVEPLISKRYVINRKILYNNQFRNQLFSNLQCEGMDLTNIQNITYRKEPLIDYFVKYNTCIDENYVYERTKRGNGDFNLSFKVGAGMANLEVERGLNAKGLEMSGAEYRAGLEFEYVFPFNRNKWAANFEPAYRKFVGEEKLTQTIIADLSIQYTSVELGFGIKHYLFLNDDSKLFFNLGYVYDLPVGSEVLFANTNRNMDPILSDFKASSSINLGVGLKFKNKYFVEAKYLMNRPFNGLIIVPENYHLDWRSKYSAITLSLGYRLF